MFAVFVIRGKPYSGENMARILLKPESLGPDGGENGRKMCCCCASCIIPLLAFAWTVVSWHFVTKILLVSKVDEVLKRVPRSKYLAEVFSYKNFSMEKV